MKSKKSFFNGALFRSNLTRFWPLWLVFLAVTILLYPVASVGGAEKWGKYATAVDVGEQLLEMSLTVGSVVMFISGAVFAMLLFYYLYTARSSGLYASLPVKREALFITNYLSGIIIFAVVMVINAVAIIIAELSLGMFNFKFLMMWLGISFMQFILFYSLAVFCGMLTGHIIVLPALYAVLNFMMYFIDMLISAILEQFVYGYVSHALIPEFLSPVVHMVSNFDITNVFAANGNDIIDLGFSHTGTAIAYAVFGVILAVLSLYIYKRRHMEMATDIVAVRPLRPVFKYCMTFGCALVLGMLLYTVVFDGYLSDGLMPMLGLTACMIVGGIIGYFVSQMLMQKTFRVFRKGWGGVVVSALVIVLLMFGCEYDLFGYERDTPEIDEIESVFIYGFGDNVTAKEEENIAKTVALHKSFIENKRVYESAKGNSYNVRMAYNLTNGERFDRRYNVYVETAEGKIDTDLLDSILNSEEAVEARLSTSVPLTEDNIMYCNVEWKQEVLDVYNDYAVETTKLTKEEAAELYDAIMKDKAEGKIGRCDSLIRCFEEPENDFFCHIYIEYAVEKDTGEKVYTQTNSSYTSEKEFAVPELTYVSTLSVEVMEESENTLEYLKTVGIEPTAFTNAAIGTKWVK